MPRTHELLIAVLALAALACGKRSTARQDAAPPDPVRVVADPRLVDPPAPPDAAPADPAVPAEVAALLAAADAMDNERLRRWLARAAEGGSLLAKPPADAEPALAALLAWDQAGGPFPDACNSSGSRVFQVLDVARVALAAFPASSREVHAVRRLAQALRAADNAPNTIVLGAQLAIEAAQARGKANVPAVEDDLPVRVARALARCAAGRTRTYEKAEIRAFLVRDRLAAGLPDVADPRAVEEAAIAEFAAETIRALEAATTADAQRAIVEARAKAAAEHPTSLLVRTSAAPYAVGQAIELLEQWRAIE